MKSILLLVAITLLTILPVNSQTIEGTYTNKWEAKSGEALAYTLILNEDNTFEFHSYRTLLSADSDISKKVNGTWNLKGHILVLKTDSEKGLGSDLNNSKARFMSVSPRNPNFNVIKPSLKFFQSDVFYAKNMELHKQESSVTEAKQAI